MGSSADAPALVLVTDRHATGGRDLVDVVARALDAGLPAVQLRDKDLSGRALLVLAERLRALTARTGALLLVNDRVDVAVAVGADGVHLGGGSMPVEVVRRMLPPHALIGVSTHAPADVAATAADFVVFGPVYATPSKAAFGAPQGVAALRGRRSGDPGHPGGRRCGAGDARPAPDARLTPRSRGLPLLAIPGRMRRGEGGYELHLLPHRGRRDSRRGGRA
jgi:thiamine-phosphate pyrophosphorylase